MGLCHLEVSREPVEECSWAPGFLRDGVDTSGALILPRRCGMVGDIDLRILGGGWSFWSAKPQAMVSSKALEGVDVSRHKRSEVFLGLVTGVWLVESF